MSRILNRVLKSLPLRLAAAMLLTAVWVATLIGYVTFQRLYQEEVQASTLAVRQLAATVRNTVAIAAYLNDTQLAGEVSEGLLGNDIVQGVAVYGTEGVLTERGVITAGSHAQAECLAVPSPFVVEEQVGRLCLYPSRGFIEQRAEQRARQQIAVILEFGLLLLLMLLLVVHKLFSNPIKKLSGYLHRFNLSDHQPLDIPTLHRGDEIGRLFEDSNRLLGSVSEAFRRERALRQEVERLENLFRNIFEQASSGIAILELDGTPRVINPSFEAMIGAQAVADIRAGHMPFVAIARNPDELKLAVTAAAQTQEVLGLDLELAVGPVPGRWVHFAMSQVQEEDGERYLEVLSYDISERRHREAQFKAEAEHDPLTGVLNRRAGERRIEYLLEQAGDVGKPCAIFMLDLDKFKPLNDTWGHEAGDQALCVVARRLESVTRSHDTIVRWGGDEFLLAIGLPRGIAEAENMAQRILASFAEPITLTGGQQAELGVSIGIALFPAHGRDLAGLVHCADQAMYKTKLAADKGYTVYQSS